MAKKVIDKVIDNLPRLKKSFAQISKQDVYVGVPNEKTDRRPDVDEANSGPVNNATLLYIHDKGSPAAGIPARPVMEPGVQAVKGRIVNAFKEGAKGALQGGPEAVDKALHKAGLIAQDSIRHRINEGPPPPLAPATIAARKRRGHESEKPLVETGQMRNAVNYVIRDKK